MSLLEVRNVSRRFGTLAAVDGVSMGLEAGELRAVIGPNGAGKTTFFNMVSGFFSPSSGTIFFVGHDITRLSVAQRVKMGIARTFQITEVFPELTLRENLQIAAEIAAGLRLRPWIGRSAGERLRARAVELLERGGLNALADRVVGELAHGDQRATEIMMALALEPRLLLLDEPSQGLAPIIVRDVFEIIAATRKEGLSVLLVEQNVRVAVQIADRAYVLDDGRIVYSGSAAELAADEERVRALAGASAGSWEKSR